MQKRSCSVDVPEPLWHPGRRPGLLILVRFPQQKVLEDEPIILGRQRRTAGPTM
jgi:hypothetical protein